MKITAFMGGLLGILYASAAFSQVSDDKIKIGVLSDFQSHYSDVGGKGSVAAAEMAIADFGKTVDGKPIELIFADHGNKPDTASSIARRWYDEEGVDLIIDVPTSAAALAVQNIAKEKGKLAIFTSPATDLLTNDNCSPTGIHWAYDSYGVAKALAQSLAKKDSSWFFVAIDTAGGASLQKSATPFIEEAGGKIVGSVRHAPNSGDMASFLLQAQSSGAQYVALANAGTDLVNAIKQATEFGITPTQSLVAIVMFLSDLRSLGLEDGKDLIYVSSFDASVSPEAAEWSKRYTETAGHLPNDVHAAVYSAISSYLQGIKSIGSDDAAKMMTYFHETPINDMYAKNGKVRADGRMVHDLYLLQAKKPEESAGPNDLVKLLQVIPGEQAFRPLENSTCSLVKK